MSEKNTVTDMTLYKIKRVDKYLEDGVTLIQACRNVNISTSHYRKVKKKLKGGK